MRTVCGRGAELAVLREFVRGASSGTGGVVRVEGPAGIGKSTLLAMTVRMADEQGLRVAAGTADELDQVTPWGPLLRAFSGATPPLLGQAELD
jgi:predicted ATPase